MARTTRRTSSPSARHAMTLLSFPPSGGRDARHHERQEARERAPEPRPRERGTTPWPGSPLLAHAFTAPWSRRRAALGTNVEHVRDARTRRSVTRVVDRQ